MRIDKKYFYETYRHHYGSLRQEQVEGIEAIIDAWDLDGNMIEFRYLAYMLATVKHETDSTFQPIKEYREGRNRTYGMQITMSGHRYTNTNEIFYGRGLVQLTWYENYEKAGRKLGVDFLSNADLVMKMEYAVPILFLGMTEGWFTGKKLSDYINGSKTDYFHARQIINGLDKAALIQGYAKNIFEGIRYE